MPKSPPRRRRRMILRDESDEDEQFQVPASELVTIKAEESTLQKENEVEGSGILKRKRSVNSNTDHISPPSRRSKKIRASVHMAQSQFEDAKEAEKGDQESLISSEPIVIEALPAPEDNV